MGACLACVRWFSDMGVRWVSDGCRMGAYLACVRWLSDMGVRWVSDGGMPGLEVSARMTMGPPPSDSLARHSCGPWRCQMGVGWMSDGCPAL